MEDTATTVLRRMIRPARPRAPRDAQGEAIRIELARIADDLHGLEVAVTSSTIALVEREEIALGERDLIFQATHDVLPAGLVAVSPALLATLIEVQIAGRVSATAPPERAPTRTDAVVAAPLLDAWMTALVEAAAAGGAFAGFRRGAAFGGRKAALLTLDGVGFTSICLGLSLGGGAREGQLAFHLPRQTGEAAGSDRADLSFLKVDLDVVLTRITRSLGEVRELAPGSVIELPREALAHAALERDGRRLAPVRLGRVDDRRAIRAADPEAGGAHARGDEIEAGDLPIGRSGRDGSAPPGALPKGKDPNLALPSGEQSDMSKAEDGTAAALPEVATPEAASPGEALPDPTSLDDLPAPDDLPPLEDLPALGDLPPLDDLPPLPGGT